MKLLTKTLTISLACAALSACEDSSSLPDDSTIRDYSAFFTPLPESPIYPADNPYSAEKEQLGELLFWDPILSGDQNVACASCHHPKFGWADGRDFSIGSDGVGLGPDRYGNEITSIHSPSIMNTAFTGLQIDSNEETFLAGPYFWDLRAQTLEEQASGPIKNPVEMLGYNYHEDNIMAEIITRLNTIGEYTYLFTEAFGQDQPITEENIVKALATFQRKIISPNARFDSFLAGDTSALSEREVIGLNKFIDGGCTDCHIGPMLSDNILREDKKIFPELDAVRTPTLRNITKTAPYMQNGSEKTLASAIGAYENRDDLGTSAGEGDFADIEVFLKSLDSAVYSKIPDSVPSGLPVGGDIH